MAISSIYKNHVDGTIAFQDATGVPITMTLQYEQGDIAVEGFEGDNEYEVSEYYDREQLASVRRNKRKIPTLSFTAWCTDLSDATEKNLMDLIRKKGAWSAGVSTHPAGANADVWLVQVTITIEGTAHGDAADHTIVAKKVRLTGGFAEGDPNKFTVSGKIYIFADADLALT